MLQRYRDFRYTDPVQPIDLVEAMHVTALWSPVDLLQLAGCQLCKPPGRSFPVGERTAS